ncbi:hypothetical protein B9G98_04368 [Wickerhamiella sorbophila]|uniref:Uncharacterized protein n=1 Tax=Wickerhamiella sorbophila TaxID=45607 RepID=A0A2T0FP42_9ASCO|nr:hypothetical protein B9G98_04368 [Wickerhamiella sorbophila]PRT56748.1 hypothetical protein B9G98_04368 [Wickerhamiella sorbophila]
MTDRESIALQQYLKHALNTSNRKRLAEDDVWTEDLENLNSELSQLVLQMSKWRSKTQPAETPDRVILVHQSVPQTYNYTTKRQLHLLANALNRIGYVCDEKNLFAWWRKATQALERLRIIRTNSQGDLVHYFTVLEKHQAFQSQLVDLIFEFWYPELVAKVRTMFALRLPGEQLDLQYLHETILAVDDPLDVVSPYHNYMLNLSAQFDNDDFWLEKSTEGITAALWQSEYSPTVVPMLIATSRLQRISPQIRVRYLRVLRDPNQRYVAQSDPMGHLADFIRQNLDTEIEAGYQGYFAPPKRRIHAPMPGSIVD